MIVVLTEPEPVASVYTPPWYRVVNDVAVLPGSTATSLWISR